MKVSPWSVLVLGALLWSACGASSGGGGSFEVLSSGGRGREWSALASPAAAHLEARARPSTGAELLELARAYYPEFGHAPMKHLQGSGSESPRMERALVARAADTSGASLELTTRGYLFRVHRSGPSSSQGQDVHIWASDSGETSGSWRTERVADFSLPPAQAGEHRLGYEIDLPEEVEALRDAGEYLEFLGGGDVPVLRMHVGTVRDGEGRSRAAETRLTGVERAPSVGPLARFMPLSRRIRVELSSGLEGASGPTAFNVTFSATTSLATPRFSHTATLLTSGKVLVVGGMTTDESLTSAELYDPETDSWSAAGRMHFPRMLHTATALVDGRVLVAGGLPYHSSSPTDTAELYDPATRTWRLIQEPMKQVRSNAAAILLNSGNVLMVGSELTAPELFDPLTETWGPTSSSSRFRCKPCSATLLRSGVVLVLTGNEARLYYPDVDMWGNETEGDPMAAGRSTRTRTTLPSGQILVVGGFGFDGILLSDTIYDPGLKTWRIMTNNSPRVSHTATLLPSGKVLLVGDNSGASGVNFAEVYDPKRESWVDVSQIVKIFRYHHTATLLPSGAVLLVGGRSHSAGALSATELYVPPMPAPYGFNTTPRSHELNATATVLRTGKVLMTGGRVMSGDSGETILGIADLFDPATQKYRDTEDLSTPRALHTATLLPSGKVLVAGGTKEEASAEVYDPDNGEWSDTRPMSERRIGHTATMLPSGEVLVAGGGDDYPSLRPGEADDAQSLRTAELYNPRTNQWRITGRMNSPRRSHTATLLPTGEVLVTGGYNGPCSEKCNNATAEVYDPRVGTWTQAPSMRYARAYHVDALLPSGKVLIVGGEQFTETRYGSGRHYPTSGEVYDPVTKAWKPGNSPFFLIGRSPLAIPRPSGNILFFRGDGSNDEFISSRYVDSYFEYVPARGEWNTSLGWPISGMTYGDQTAALLPSGQILVTEYGAKLSSYDDLDVSNDWRPNVLSPDVVEETASLTLRGTGFRGLSEGSSGQGSSPTNHPVQLSLMSVETGALTRLSVSRFSDTEATVALPQSPRLPAGEYILSMSVNGIRGGKVVHLKGPPFTFLTPPLITSEDTALPIPLRATDPDEDPVTFKLLSPPKHGRLSGDGFDLVYTPARSFSGTDSFTWAASDGVLESTPETVSITVKPVNNAPVARSLSLQAVKDRAVPLKLVATDADGDALTYTLVSSPQGTLSGEAPDYTYRPAQDFVGTTTFQYKVSDGKLESSVATVEIQVQAVDAAPVARDLSVTSGYEHALEVQLRGSDKDSKELTYLVVTPPTRGTLTGTPPVLIYTPEPGYIGIDSFTYKVRDATSDSNVATVSITVTNPARPQVPVGCSSGDGLSAPLALVALRLLRRRIRTHALPPPCLRG